MVFVFFVLKIFFRTFLKIFSKALESAVSTLSQASDSDVFQTRVLPWISNGFLGNQILSPSIQRELNFALPSHYTEKSPGKETEKEIISPF